LSQPGLATGRVDRPPCSQLTTASNDPFYSGVVNQQSLRSAIFYLGPKLDRRSEERISQLFAIYLKARPSTVRILPIRFKSTRSVPLNPDALMPVGAARHERVEDAETSKNRLEAGVKGFTGGGRHSLGGFYDQRI
jgi:hypothetical protein